MGTTANGNTVVSGDNMSDSTTLVGEHTMVYGTTINDNDMRYSTTVVGEDTMVYGTTSDDNNMRYSTTVVGEHTVYGNVMILGNRSITHTSSVLNYPVCNGDADFAKDK